MSEADAALARYREAALAYGEAKDLVETLTQQLDHATEVLSKCSADRYRARIDLITTAERTR